MNMSDSAGEPSCKPQENGDASTGSDRPLKKARFAWQVKGKYHLKSETPEPSAAASTSERESPSSSSQNDTGSIGNTEQNLEILGDYLLKQDFNTLDSVITDPDKSLLQPSTSTEKLEYPRYVSSLESKPCYSRSAQIAKENEDLIISRWQAKQMAKGFVDNTINRVLDSWMGTPSAPRERPILVFDIAEFVDDIPEDNTHNIENEGILMAISAHGLQANTPFQINDRLHINNEPDDCWQQIPFEHPSLSPDDDRQSSSIEFEDGNASGNDILTNHFDFIDTAVSFAIQNKGLTSSGTDYG